jgi:hypothetical protein
MRAILINVNNKCFEEVVIHSIYDMYKYIDCNVFTITKVIESTDCYVDDEALLKQGYIDENGIRHNLSGFFSKANPCVVMGNGLVVGSVDEFGVNTDCPYGLEEIEKLITFVDFDKEEDRPQPYLDIFPIDNLNKFLEEGGLL